MKANPSSSEERRASAFAAWATVGMDVVTRLQNEKGGAIETAIEQPEAVPAEPVEKPTSPAG